jgi:hypothetical protein
MSITTITPRATIQCAECCAHGDHTQGYHVCPACLPSLPTGSSVRRLRLRHVAPPTGCEIEDHNWDRENVCTDCGAQAQCDDCYVDAIVQEDFAGFLCPDHLEAAYESAHAERLGDMARDGDL